MELEFSVAFVYPRNVRLPDPTETRKLLFKPYRNEIDRFITEDGLPLIVSTTELADYTIYERNWLRHSADIPYRRITSQHKEPEPRISASLAGRYGRHC